MPQLLFLVFGLVAVFVGGLLEFYGGPEVHGGANWFMMVFGAVCILGGLGTIPHDKPQPAPAPKKQPERKAETPAEIAEREEREWRTNPKSKAPVRCATQFMEYLRRGEPQKAREFLDAMNDDFYNAAKIGAKIIREHEERF